MALLLNRAASMFCACLLTAAAARAQAEQPGSWSRPRQNHALTAIQPMPGNMATTPAVVGRYDLGRTRPGCTRARVTEEEDDLSLCIAAGALYAFDQDGSQRWRLHPPGLNFARLVAVADVDGDTRNEAVLQAGRPTQPFGAAVVVDLARGAVTWRYDVEPMSYAWYLYVDDFLPQANGQQIVVVMHGYPPDADNGYIVLFDAGEPGATLRQRWRYDFHEYTCFPSLLRTDLDGDGVQEICVQTHSRLWAIDPRTGRVVQFLGWDVAPANVRSYGLTRFVDLDGDGREDFLCLANFAQHHEVLLNRDGRLELAWAHGWDESVTTGDVASNWPEPPYADLDGDGRLELVVSMYNSEAESDWLVRVYDAVSGELKYRFPGAVATALADIDGDGRAEILAGRTREATGKVLDGALVLGVDAADPKMGLAQRFHLAGAQPVRRESTQFRVRYEGIERTLAWQQGEVVLAPVSVAPDLGATRPTKTAIPIPELSGTGTPQLLAADLDNDGRNELLLYRDEEAVVLQWMGDRFRESGRYPSSGMPVIADIDGDDRMEIVTGSVDPQQQPRLEAWRPGGEPERIWSMDFPPLDGAALPYGHRLYLQAGRFTGRAGQDLYVWAGVPRVRSAVVDGGSGRIVWERGKMDVIERYWGPSVNVAASWDVDGDGAQDLVFTAPDYYCVVSGRDGTTLHGPDFPPDIFDQPSQGLYSFPAVLERGDWDPHVALVGAHYFVGVMSLAAQGLWHQLPVAGLNRAADEGFLRTQDGIWLMGYGRQNGNFACVEVASGDLRWELPIQATASDVITMDVDGDGHQEFVFATSHGHLWAVGDDGDRPRVVWRADLPAGGSGPIAADVDGDGVSEIVLTTVDGYVTVLK
jgi:hypothetical protein